MQNTLKFAIFIITIISLSGCMTVNGFSKYYHDNRADLPGGKPDYVEFYTGEPKIIYGKNKINDDTNMIDNGYFLIGYSSFLGPYGSIDDAKSVAEDIGAEFFVYYATYLDTVSGTYTYTTQNPNQIITSNSYGNINTSGNIYGNHGSLNYYGNSNYSGSTTTTVSGGYTTHNMPYTINRYNFGATYWSKKRATESKTYHESQQNRISLATSTSKLNKDTASKIIYMKDGQEIYGGYTWKDVDKVYSNINGNVLELDIDTVNLEKTFGMSN